MIKKSFLTAMALALAACGSGPDSTETFVTGVGYVGATVADLDRTTAIYTDAADLKVVEDKDLSEAKVLTDLLGETGKISSRMLRSVNGQVRYMQFESPADAEDVPINGPGIAHLCLQVNKDTEAYQKFLSSGATAIGDPAMQQLNPRNPVEYAYVRDPDGAVMEIEHVDVSALDLPAPPKNKYRLRHVAFATPDIDRLTKFYSKFLGQPKPRRIGRLGGFGGEKIDAVSGLEGSKIKMSWFKTRNMEIELAQYVSHPSEIPTEPRPLNAPGFNMIVFDVSDLDKAKESFVAAGGTLAGEPGELDGGQIVFGYDPDMNLIGMQVPSAGSVVDAAQFKNDGAE